MAKSQKVASVALNRTAGGKFACNVRLTRPADWYNDDMPELADFDAMSEIGLTTYHKHANRLAAN